MKKVKRSVKHDAAHSIVEHPSAPKPTSRIVMSAKSVGDHSHRFFMGLLWEQKLDDHVWYGSMGRAAFWLVFIHVLYCFITRRIVTDAELYVLYALLGYGGGKILSSSLTDAVSAFKSTTVSSTVATIDRTGMPELPHL